MPRFRSLLCYLVLSAAFAASALAQNSAAPAAQAKAPLDHVIGTITAVDKSAQTVSVQEDKTSAAHTIQLANTKTLLKVEPTAKDLKAAVRISADDLEVGDRVDVRGTKLEDSPTTFAARSVILMSARELAATHQEQAAAWAKATSGRVTAVDPATGTITADVRVAGAAQPTKIQTAPTTEFTRYSPETGKAAPSQISQIQPGDQVKVIGQKSDDGTSVTAQRVYSGAFRTIAVTVSSLSEDGKTITAKDLATKKQVVITLNTDASIHKLPPMMASFLAHRLNPNAPAGTGRLAGDGAGAPASGGAPSGGGGQWTPGASGGPAGPGGPAGSGGGGPGGGGRGDISQMIDRTPKIAVSDLKPGDALVISGVATGDNTHLLANTLIAGVEPILQAAPTQSGGRSLGGDWGLGDMSVPQ